MSRNDSQLVIRDVPVFLWLLGLVFGGIGLLILFEGRLPVAGVAFTAIGLSLLIFVSLLTITADGITRTLKLEYRSMVRHKLKQISFDEIAGINVERKVASSGRGSQPTYRVAILLKDEQVIPLRSYSSSGWRKKEQRALQLRQFIGIEDSNRMPSGMLPPEFAQSLTSGETDGIRWQIQPMVTASANAPTGLRWHSTDFKTSEEFLLAAQKAEGQSSGGFLASLGNMLIRPALALHGFQPEDTPNLDQSSLLSSPDPALDPHFMVYSSSPDFARQLLDPKTVALIAGWAGRYPLKQLQKGAHGGPLMILFGPNGVCLATLNLTQRSQAYELISMGVELIQCQKKHPGPQS